MNDFQHDQLVWLISNRQGWYILKDGEDQSGPYVAALHLQSDQAHQFRSTNDWDINRRLIECGEGGGNLGLWSQRTSGDM